MKEKIQKFKKIWRGAIKNWSTKYRFVLKNESSKAERYSLVITPRKLFVVITVSVVVLIMITALLLSVTALRVYIPGYTNPEEYRMYKQITVQVDSLELLLKQNQQYIDNFYHVINEDVENENKSSSTSQSTPNVNPVPRDPELMAKDEKLREEAETLLNEIDNTSEQKSELPITQRANIRSITLYPPAVGSIISEFNISTNHYGIDIKNARNTLIMAVSDGVVIFSGFDPDEGNVIIIQHPGNIISVYKHNEVLLKSSGARVRTGEPIAKMGNSGLSDHNEIHLHFELWYNGFPINPLDYLTVK